MNLSSTDLLGRISARLDAVSGRLFGAPAPVASRAAEPVPCRPGPVALAVAPSVAPRAPAGVPDTFDGADRDAHRHAWAPAGVVEGNRAAVVAALERWLREDRPGTGLAWEHASDVAARLVHWHAALAWGDLPNPLRAGLAGSAGWHLAHLRARLPGTGDPLRRVVYGAGLVVGGLTFPDLPDARTAWSEGLAALRFDMPRAFAGDGTAFGAPPAVAGEALWAVAIARAVTRAAGAAFPSDADAAFARGARWLERIAGEIGPLPPVGDSPPAPVLAADAPIAWSLWNLARAWGLAEGDPAPGADADPRLAWLGVRAPGGTPEPAPKTWAMWHFREGGDAVAAMRIKSRPSRVIASFGPASACPQAHPAPLAVLWDVGDVAVLADPGCAAMAPALRTAHAHTTLTLDGREPPGRWDARLTLARVDGKKARISGTTDAWSSVGFQHERDVLLNQARLLVTDRLVPVGRARGRHALRVAFQLGVGWAVEHDGTNWIAKNGALTLVVQLPATLAWSVVSGQEGAGRVHGPDGALVDAPCFVGDGGIDGETRFTASFEVR